ncbi:hypothetical protein GOBAR_AA21530 [Gossypium barbadense]|uniref:Heparanase-like protein 2 n=1 Tax=Gossypium barbadense TaxID=3634 RepID=A0A2P5X732_GOSBA|nr:hypothetical protein GOBAR_AA21530 [Gossypium barbadense]
MDLKCIFSLAILVSQISLSSTQNVNVVIQGAASIGETDDNLVCTTLDWWPTEKCNYNQCPWGKAGLLNLDLKKKGLINAIKDDPNMITKIQDPSYLNQVAQTYKGVLNIVNKFKPQSGAWVSESGGALHGGAKDFSPTLADGFWYLDQLGVASTYNHKVFCRKTLIGGNYALLNATTSIPNLDYHGALLWHRLLGSTVLAITQESNPNLRVYAHCAKKKFNPLRIKVGGSLQDQVVYGVGGVKNCPNFMKNEDSLFGFSQGCLPMERWDELNKIFNQTGVKVTFGLNALLGRNRSQIEKGLWVGDWKSQNARDFMKYTISKGYKVDSYEFGNQLSGAGMSASVEAEQYGKDIVVLKNLVKELHPDPKTQPKVLGPSGYYDEKWFNSFLEVSGHDVVDGVTHHIYNLGPPGISTIFINLSKDSSFNVTLSNYEHQSRNSRSTDVAKPEFRGSKDREEYHLAALAGNIQGQIVLLNDVPMVPTETFDIPTMEPKLVNASTPISIAAHSIVYVTIRDFQAPACA